MNPPGISPFWWHLFYFVVLLVLFSFQITSCTSFREGSESEVPSVWCRHVFLFSNVFAFFFSPDFPVSPGE